MPDTDVELWNYLKVSSRDLVDAAQHVHRMAEALAIYVDGAHSDNAECASEGSEAESADVAMLVRMLDHLDVWARFLNGNREDLRERLVLLGIQADLRDD